MSSKFNLLVFDWDGTLMDSEARIIACMQAAAADLEIDVPDDNSVRNIIGLGLAQAVEALFPSYDESVIPRMVDRYRFHFLQENKTPSELFEGAEAVLRHLQGQGYLMAVATGKGRAGLDKVLDETGLHSLFHATRTADETFSKPNPEMLFQIMNELGADPEETLVIGDSEYDLLMANNAKTDSLAVSYGVHEVPRLMQHGPLACLDDISELVPWLDQAATGHSQSVG
ncbi:MAG: HAD-IA family hydrolase [Candidatus Sedimenticola sp. PURPLELP]